MTANISLDCLRPPLPPTSHPPALMVNGSCRERTVGRKDGPFPDQGLSLLGTQGHWQLLALLGHGAKEAELKHCPLLCSAPALLTTSRVFT